jgi:AbiV family abortive infection protein
MARTGAGRDERRWLRAVGAKLAGRSYAPALASFVMSKAMQVPELDVLGDFAIAAARNSRRLLEDAELLASRGRWPGAYSYAILAFEEAGKAWLCIIAMMMPDDSRDEFPFGDLDWDHTWKLGAAHGMAFMLSFIRGGEDAPESIFQDGNVIEALARKHNQAKQRGIYADLTDGVVWEPAQITRDEARGMVAAVRDLLDYGGPLADPEFIAWLAAMPAEDKPLVDAFWVRLLSGWEQAGYDGMADAVKGFIEEIASVDELREMLQEDGRRLAIDRAPKRAQPRRPPPRSQRRGDR